MAKPMLDDLELQQAQRIASAEEEVYAEHAVPALEGDFLQDLGRRAVRIEATAMLTGPEAKDRVADLREKFRAADKMPFVADIATATRVDPVLVESLSVRERAGRPDAFEIALALREWIDPPAPETEDPPIIPPDPPVDEIGALEVTVLVEGRPEFDFSTVTVTARGTRDSGEQLDRPLTGRSGNIWTEEGFPPGRYEIRAVVESPEPMSGAQPADVRPGQTTEVTIVLRPGAQIAKAFIIHYRFDRAFVEPCLREVLRRVVDHSNAHPDEKLLIVGHTDRAGSGDYNQFLSERRARGVYAFLVFGRERELAIADWNELRKPAGGASSLADSWSERDEQRHLAGAGDRLHGAGLVRGSGRAPVPQRRCLRGRGTAPLARLRRAGAGQEHRVRLAAYPAHRDPVRARRPPSLPGATTGHARPAALLGHPRPAAAPLAPRARKRQPAPVFRDPRSERARQVSDPGGRARAGAGVGDDHVRGRHAGAERRVRARRRRWRVPPHERCGSGGPGRGAARHRHLAGRPADPRPRRRPGALLLSEGDAGGDLHPRDLRSRPAAGGAREGRGAGGGARQCDLSRVSPRRRRHAMTPPGGVIQRVPVAPSPIAGTFTFPANRAAPTVPIPVMVRHLHTAPARVEVVVGVSRRFRGTGGTLDESGKTAAIRWFDRATGGTAIVLPPAGLQLTAAQLNRGFHLFAESNVPSDSVGDYVLTLTLAGGPDPLATPPASVGITAVRLTIDVFPPGPAFGTGVPAPMPEPPATAPPAGTATDKWFLGRTVNVQDAALAQARARIRVRQVEPSSFAGRLSIRQRALSGTTLGRDIARAALLDDDLEPPPGLPPPAVPAPANPNPFAFPPPSNLGRDFFVEGRALSAARRDVAFQLGLEGGEPDGHRVAFTIGVGCSIAIDNALRAVLVKKAPAN